MGVVEVVLGREINPLRHRMGRLKLPAMSTSLIVACVVIGVAALGLAACRTPSTPQPKYSSIQKEGEVEIREYGPMIVAEADVTGERSAAINQGFRIIAGYIFGGNVPAEKIAMTAPVTQQRGESIAMTAPVTQQAEGVAWKVRFVMPGNYTLETLPKPTDERVKLISIPAKRFVVSQFSGSQNDANMKNHEATLLAYVTAHNLRTVGDPVYAFYDPPWILPFLKRNEVMIELPAGNP